MEEYKEFSGKTIDEALTEASIALESASENIEYEIVSEKKNLFKKEIVIKARVKKTEPDKEDIIKEFLGQVLDKMEMSGEVAVEIDEDEKEIKVNIDGENAKDVIGNRGQTLDALQYLAANVVNKGQEDYYRVTLDALDYRDRRRRTLENLAKNTAAKVKKTRHKVALNPMNPYERRIIHSYLQSDSQVTTRSEGVDPHRRVVVYYKR